MKKTLKILEKWFDLNIGWFFINDHKQEDWRERLKEKYPEEYKASK
jgi:hypothetical protein